MDMTREVMFSKRFYGATGMFLALIFTLGFLPQTARALSNRPPIFLVVVILILLAALLGTLGWRYALRKGTLAWMRRYFAFQFAIAFLMFTLEIHFAGASAGASNFVILLVLQASVLPRKWHLLAGGLMWLMLMLVSVPYQSGAHIIGALVSSLLISAAILLMGYLIASEERARQAADEANRKLATYAAQVETLATVNERNRLAREIHDNLGHYLSAVNMQIEAAVTIIERDPERAVQTLRKAQGLAKDGLAQIRDSVAVLRADPTQERPLHEALTRLVDEGRADGLTIDYQVKGTIRPCAGEIEMALYRIVQEGLTNIRKHAQATRAEVELCYDENGRVRLKVRDNGRGRTGGDGGFGLLGIQERVKLLDGTLAIQTAPGQGFSLEVEITA
jgi:signal transduction histidine kinase